VPLTLARRLLEMGERESVAAYCAALSKTAHPGDAGVLRLVADLRGE
jgi:hypothetical protein